MINDRQAKWLMEHITKYSFYKAGKNNGQLPVNFLRHYYDLYCLLELEEIKSFIGTPEYEDYKKERFRGYDTEIKKCDGFTLKDQKDRDVFKANYEKSSSLYYKGKVDFELILSRFQTIIEKL